jgi:hypothetical protein
MTKKTGTPHVKPTNEELEANAQKALEEIETLDKEKEDKNEEDVEEVEESDDDEVADDEEEADDNDSDDEEEEPEEEDESDEVDDADDKEVEKPKNKKLKDLSQEEKDKKLKASTRESLVLHAKNKKIQESIREAASLEAPTDAEMEAKYSNWEDMDTITQDIARESFATSRRMEAITKVTEDFDNQEVWDKKVDTFIDDVQTITNNPKLEGAEDEFRSFASKPTRRGVDIGDLVNAFLYEREESRPAKKKGKMYPDGSGGHKRDKPKKTKLSASEAGNLRKTDYNKWREMLKTGKIDPTDL